MNMAQCPGSVHLLLLENVLKAHAQEDAQLIMCFLQQWSSTMELITNVKASEPTCQSLLERLFRTSAIFTGNFPEKVLLLGQQIFRDILFHKKQRTRTWKLSQKKKKSTAVGTAWHSYNLIKINSISKSLSSI